MKRIFFLTAIVVAFLLLIAFLYKTFYPSGNITRELKNKTYTTCSTSSNCTVVPDPKVCSGCSCGIAVNVESEKEFRERYENNCSNYKGPICQMYCPFNTKCILGTCKLVKK